MPQEDTQDKIQTLGAFLRDHREQKGVSLTDVSQETRISLPVLTAIEEDAYERMPAVAFCRGFYSLYADYLELDTASILERYSENMAQEVASSTEPAKPPIIKSKTFSNYAEPSSISPATGKSVSLMLCLIAIIGASFFFNWNPIDYISDKPTTESQTPVRPEQLPIDPAAENKAADQLPESTRKEQATMAPYKLEIDFHSNGTFKVTLDDGFILDKHFTAGTSLQYQVQKKIILDMPETIVGTIRLNGVEIPLPEVENGRRKLSLPEDIF
jgi:cytoskeletal protein RodZ